MASRRGACVTNFSTRVCFLDLDRARQIITAWIADYNTRRPHSSLGYRTPTAYADHLTATKGVSTGEALIAAG
jgi:putative transposase